VPRTDTALGRRHTRAMRTVRTVRTVRTTSEEWWHTREALERRTSRRARDERPPLAEFMDVVAWWHGLFSLCVVIESYMPFAVCIPLSVIQPPRH
jgi:hypothetical protein